MQKERGRDAAMRIETYPFMKNNVRQRMRLMRLSTISIRLFVYWAGEGIGPECSSSRNSGHSPIQTVKGEYSTDIEPLT